MTSQDPGRARASHADRDHVIQVLKVAFVQGRLTKDEFDARVGQTFASRTYAELAVITADIPAGLAAAESRRGPGRAPRTDAWGAGVVIAGVLLVGAALIGNERLTYLVVAAVCAAAFVAAAQMLYSRHEQRPGRALPPPSAQARLVAQGKARA